MTKWVKDADVECDTWVALKAQDSQPGLWWRASVHESGGVHLTIPSQMDIDMTDPAGDYLYRKDIDDLIARLQTLRETAKDHFGPSWNKK